MIQDEGPRDWDRELAKIDKLMAAGPGKEPAAASKAPAAKAGGIGAGVPAPRGGALLTWLRLGLGLLLGIGMTQWPYVHGCGLPLAGYLAGVAAVIVAALWTMISSWRTRSAVAHFLSVGLLFWGATLAAREILPRAGYAKQEATWTCAATPDPAAERPVP